MNYKLNGPPPTLREVANFRGAAPVTMHAQRLMREYPDLADRPVDEAIKRWFGHEKKEPKQAELPVDDGMF